MIDPKCFSCPYANSPLCLKRMREKKEEEVVGRSIYVDLHPEYEYIPVYPHTPIAFGANDQIEFVFPFQFLQEGCHERWTDVINADYFLDNRKILLFVCHPAQDEEFYTPSPTRTPSSLPVGVIVKK